MAGYTVQLSSNRVNKDINRSTALAGGMGGYDDPTQSIASKSQLEQKYIPWPL